MATIFEIGKNQPDSQRSSPRAVIAILPFVYTEVIPIRVITQNATKSSAKLDDAKLALRNGESLIADPSEILSLTITEDKKSPIGTMSAVLQPSQYNYLEACNPGDYVFAWICPDVTTSNDLIGRIRQQLACNDPKYGLKFFGKIYSCEEIFQIDGGVKTVRYNVSAQSFDYYQSQIFNTPEAIPFDKTPDDLAMYSRTFFANIINGLTNAQNSQIFKDITYNAQDQVTYLHQAFMGAGTSTDTSDNNALFKSAPNMFAIPPTIGKLFGRGTQNQNASQPLTFSYILNILVGVFDYQDQTVSDVTVKDFSATFRGGQTFASGDGIGPNFEQNVDINTGTVYQPTNENFFLKGRRQISISPSMRGSIWEILKEHSNPLINEMYTCLRADPKSNQIFPTFICRQIPMSFNSPDESFSITYFDDIPRFRIDKSNILAYSLNKNNELRMNTFFIQPLNASIVGSQSDQEAMALANIGYQIDPQDARKHGLRPFISQVYENFSTDKIINKQYLTFYTKFIRDINANLHLKLNGSLVTWGITDFICIGENLQIGDDLLFHIEKITHSYSIQAGIPIFRTSFDLSHGLGLDPDTLSVKGEKPTDTDSEDVFTEFHPSYNVFTPTKSHTDSLAQVRGNSFNDKSIPDTAQETLSLDKTNGEK